MDPALRAILPGVMAGLGPAQRFLESFVCARMLSAQHRCMQRSKGWQKLPTRDLTKPTPPLDYDPLPEPFEFGWCPVTDGLRHRARQRPNHPVQAQNLYKCIITLPMDSSLVARGPTARRTSPGSVTPRTQDLSCTNANLKCHRDPDTWTPQANRLKSPLTTL